MHYSINRVKNIHDFSYGQYLFIHHMGESRFAIGHLLHPEGLHLNGLLIMVIAGVGLLLDGFSLKISPHDNDGISIKKSANLMSGRLKVINGVVFYKVAFVDGALIHFLEWHSADAVLSIIAASVMIVLVAKNIVSTSRQPV